MYSERHGGRQCCRLKMEYNKKHTSITGLTETSKIRVPAREEKQYQFQDGNAKDRGMISW